MLVSVCWILILDSQYICSMKKIFIFLVAVCLTGCVSNDLPYPVLVPNITSVIVDEAQKVDINYKTRKITIYLPETSDIRNVAIRSVHVDQEVATFSMELAGVHDLTNPIRFTVKTYDDYEWTIVGVRNVERYFTINGQIGSSAVDEVNRRAVAVIGSSGSLSNVTVTSLKLGAEGLTTYSISKEHMKNFVHPVIVEVTEFGRTSTWTLYVEQSDISIGIQDINAWAKSAYVTTIGVSGVRNSVRYRKVGSSDWNEVDESDMISDGGTFVAHIKGLKPETEYEAVAVSGDDVSEIKTFITEAATPMPNGSFEYASLVSGASYYKFYDPDCGVEDCSYMFWGSGNGEGAEGVNGSASMGIVITYIDTQEKYDGKQSVRAQTSQLAGILAAGNLFTGQFAGLVGTSGGKVNFGRPWTTRPVALKLYCKYMTGKMDIIGKLPPGVSLTSNDYDCAEIKFALGTWDYRKYGGTPASPVHINTTDIDSFVDFKTDQSTVAHGGVIIHNDGYVLNDGEKVAANTAEWVEYTIPLNYHSMETTPTHLIISCAASRYGDYFSGCSSSRLWIDAVELIY